MQNCRNRQIAEDLKLIDVVIEILDSRIPISSRNPDIANLTSGKDKIIILNKSDLADKKQNELWVQYFKEKGQPAILANCNEEKGINEILRATEKIKQAEMEEYAEKGRTERRKREAEKWEGQNGKEGKNGKKKNRKRQRAKRNKAASSL